MEDDIPSVGQFSYLASHMGCLDRILITPLALNFGQKFRRQADRLAASQLVASRLACLGLN